MPMTPEQLARMRELAGAPDLGDNVEIQADPTVQHTTTNAHNDVFTNIPTPTQAGMPGTGMGSKPMSAQEQMRARMRAGNGAHTASTMTQGEQYNPTSSPTPTPTPTPTSTPTSTPVHAPTQQSASTQSPIANQTIINTTQTEQDEPKKGFGFKMTPIIAIAITIAVLLAGFLGYSYYVKHKDDVKPTDTEQANTETEWVDPFADDGTQWIVPETQWNYTAEQIQQLRAAGYTGDEIEQYASTQTPYLDLIKQAEAARDAYIQEAIAPLYDTASDEYKHYISQTWLSLRERNDVDGWIPCMTYLKERQNLDYEKIEVHGNQLFLKVYLDDFAHDDWFYVLVTPEQWNSLNDAGNVLVTYEYATSYDGEDAFTAAEDTNNIYIINAYIDQAY